MSYEDANAQSGEAVARLSRRTLRREVCDDGGFTLIELVVAMMVIGVVLVSLVMVQTSALVTTAQTRQRTQATAIANATMEELRALPWLVLEKGLNASFASAVGGDPNVASGRFRPPTSPGIDEALVMDSSQATDKLPLSGAGGTNVTTSSDPAIPGLVFTTRVYVTRSSDTAKSLTLSVVTSWVQKGTAKSRSVLVRSQAYAPDGGCGDAANQPFLGACQAIVSAQAGAAGPALTLSPTSYNPAVPLAPGAPLLPSLAYGTAMITSFGSGAAMTSQQSTDVQSTGLAPDVALTPLDPSAADVHTAGAGISNEASNDVGTQGAAPSNPANVLGTLSASSSSLSSGASTLTLTPGSGASATAKTSLAVSCQTGVPAGQGCGSASTTGGSGASAILTVGTTQFGLASVAAGPTSSFSARFTSAAGSSAVGCTTLTGAGCASAGAQRSMSGTSQFATGPWASGKAGSGLVTVTNYTDSILGQRGASQQTTTTTVTRTGTLTYWNGTGYSSVTLSPTTSATYTTQPVTWSAGSQSVTATAAVTVTPAASLVQGTDTVACQASACGINADAGTVTVSVTYLVNDGTSTYGLFANANYGTSRVGASYKAALNG